MDRIGVLQEYIYIYEVHLKLYSISNIYGCKSVDDICTMPYTQTGFKTGAPSPTQVASFLPVGVVDADLNGLIIIRGTQTESPTDQPTEPSTND